MTLHASTSPEPPRSTTVRPPLNGVHFDHRSAGLVDPFDGFFRGGPPFSPEPESLLDHPAVKQWFETIAWTSESGLYSLQQPFESKSGPCVELHGRQYFMMSSYDYLGLIGHPEIERAAAQAVHTHGTATGGVRLLTGTMDLHRELEHRLADFKGTDAAMLFSSGYLANVGVISALLHRDDRAIVDEKVHRSILDACRLAGVPTWRFRHNDPASLKRTLDEKPPGRRTLIIAEGAYSMDGDICPLPNLVSLKKEYGAYLMIDEAHSLGVLGDSGRGVDEHYAMSPDDVDIWTGSLSKAIPSNGGFVAGRRDLVYYLQHGAAPFFFSAAVTPSAVAAAAASFDVLEREPERLQRMRDHAAYLETGLRDLGYDVRRGGGAIVPVIIGEFARTMKLARALFDEGVIATAVAYPAVRRGSARLRLCATAAQSPSMLDQVLAAFREVRGILES